MARLIALAKRSRGVRGIATGEVLRRLVARALAQQFGPELNAACMPYQFALGTRAGTDCLGLLLRALTDLDDNLVVVSLDGVGAYDHISRAPMQKLDGCKLAVTQSQMLRHTQHIPVAAPFLA